MTLNFPPRPSHTREIESIVQVLAGVITGRSAIYVSAPITSGKRFSHRARRIEPDLHRNTLFRDVIEPNLAHAASVVELLRRRKSGPLIDPTAVDDLANWSQDDYRHLWGSVIERYVQTVVFLDDWQYSNGCAYEFLVAQRCELTTCDERDEVISLEDGIARIDMAIEESKTMATPTVFLEHVLDALCELNQSEGALSGRE
jgi:hypothetical protein